MKYKNLRTYSLDYETTKITMEYVTNSSILGL